MKVGELRLEKMEKGLVCEYSKAEERVRWTIWQRWRRWRGRGSWELGCLWRHIDRGRLRRICTGAICFPDIYGDDVIFVTEDHPWKYSGKRRCWAHVGFRDLKPRAGKEGLAQDVAVYHVYA